MTDGFRSTLTIGIAVIALLLGIKNHYQKPKEIIREIRIEKYTVEVIKKEYGYFEKQVNFWGRDLILDTLLSLIYDRKNYPVYATTPVDSAEDKAKQIKKELEQKGNKVTLRIKRTDKKEKADIILSTKRGLRQIVENAIKESQKYPFIEDSLKKYGLDPKLKWLPIIESGYNNKSRSFAKAAGIWQFIPSTARAYGLKVRRGLDERLDVPKATGAFCRYMVDLQNKLGTLPLALTAYNHGENGIARKLKETNGTSLEDIYHLLGFASKNFYGSFLAAVDVAENWKKYGLTVEELKPLIKEVDVELETENVHKPDTQEYLLLYHELFYKNIEPADSTSNKKKIYVVKSRDNLTRIAKKHEIHLDSLIKYNNLKTERINPGDTLLLPVE